MRRVGSATEEEIIIAEQVEPEYLLSAEEHRQLTDDDVSVADFISMPEDIEIEFEPVKLDLKIPTL